MNPLAARVREERLRRRWSVRKCATEGGISNTWWQNFENDVQPITDLIAAAVAQAFEWPADWATTPLAGEEDTKELLRQVLAHVLELTELVKDRLDPPRGSRRASGGAR